MYKTLVTVYLVLGLLSVMTMVHLVTNIPELDITPWFRSQYDTVRSYCVNLNSCIGLILLRMKTLSDKGCRFLELVRCMDTTVITTIICHPRYYREIIFLRGIEKI